MRSTSDENRRKPGLGCRRLALIIVIVIVVMIIILLLMPVYYI